MTFLQKTLVAAVASAALWSAAPCEAVAPSMWATRYRAPTYNWNANYAHVQYGQPVAVPLPPTVRLQTNWGWGVGSSRISRVDHQFGRNYPGPGPHGGPFYPQPQWPSDTTQFGAYYVRGPW